MGELVYILCFLMSLFCATLLLRARQRAPEPLLLWSGLCFVGLALTNAVLVVDMVVMPAVDFGGPLLRTALAAGSGCLLLYGLIWELK
jgi:hypothetical protein